MRMRIVPITLREANDFVEQYHEHNGRTSRDGGKFAIGLDYLGNLVGVAIVGNPLSSTYMDGFTVEVLRVCTDRERCPKGGCSKLYSRCWRIWQAMGGTKCITYTLPEESGASLRGAGWSIVGQTKSMTESGPVWKKNDGLDRQWQPIYGQMKFRWEINKSSNNDPK